MSTKHEIGPALEAELTEDGRLRIHDAGKITYALSTEETLELVLWLRQYQNYIVLAKAQQDERRAMLAEIEQERSCERDTN